MPIQESSVQSLTIALVIRGMLKPQHCGPSSRCLLNLWGYALGLIQGHMQNSEKKQTSYAAAVGHSFHSFISGNYVAPLKG